MTVRRIDVRDSRTPSDDVSLHEYVKLLVNQPFRFARVSYGDELTLHFGELRPSPSPKLEGKPHGAFVFGVLGSRWVLESPSKGVRYASDDSRRVSDAPTYRSLNNEAFEREEIVRPGSLVLRAVPFRIPTRYPWSDRDGCGLDLAFSDGSVLFVVPTDDESQDGERQPLPDWELIVPGGLLSVGPGLAWSYGPFDDE